jgi:glucose-6-phosphate-specific signal transduction histidine kinase
VSHRLAAWGRPDSGEWYVTRVEDASYLQGLCSRLITAALEERRRIERALHDGAQQDLIQISVRLQLARDLVPVAPADAVSALDEVRDEARRALDRLRALASEIYPPILEARGLSDALRQAVGASEATVRVRAAGLGRYPAETEAVIFFLWRAVLDGLKAPREAVIVVREEDEALLVEISTGEPIDLTPVRDLVEGAGGTLTVDSKAARSRIVAAFPLGA